MNLFKRLVRKLFADGPSRKTAGKPRAQLQVEGLEDRMVPAGVTFHGGPVLQHVQTENVYYGQGWASDPGTIKQLDQFVKTLSGSDYMSMLGEYGVGVGNFYGHDLVDGSSSPASKGTVNDGQIQQMLIKELQAHNVPEENGSYVYLVYLPPNVVSQNDAGSTAHHGSFTAPVGPEGLNQTVYYIVITNPVGSHPNNWAAGWRLTNFQGQTEATTHELAETVTDPALNGWYGSGGEIGDIVNAQFATFDGYTVQKEWSNQFNEGIAPTRDSPGSANNPATIRPSSIWNLGVQNNTNGESLQFGFDTNGHAYYQWVTATGQDLGWFAIS
jgi:hypothetical protein